CLYFFFFSSRRRHTRCLSDWSSDVCSSDLRQDIGRIGGPEEDPLTPKVRRPRLIDFGAVGEQPATDHRFGEACAFLARRGSGKEIGRASCRERVEIWVADGGVKKKRVVVKW